MKAGLHRPIASILLTAVALFGPACKEGKSPTEPAAAVATPTPRPTPTPAGNTAILSGIVKDQSGAPYAGSAIVQCQSWSTGTRSSPVGYYELQGLRPGKAIVNVYAQGQNKPQSFDIELKTGANTMDPSIVIVHGEPALMSGVVKFTSGRSAGDVSIFCQGYSTKVAADGTYVFPGLTSGHWDVSLVWDSWSGEYYGSVTLNPGTNNVNFSLVY
jgi:hypothetical protein